jgi:hypothetical protein
MWGFMPSEDRRLASRIFDLITDPLIIRNYNPFFVSLRGSDQLFLRDHVYPRVAFNSLIHDSFHCNRWPGEERAGDKSWPVRRKGNCFVGLPSTEPCEESGTFRPECPRQCRPVAHQDWIFC